MPTPSVEVFVNFNLDSTTFTIGDPVLGIIGGVGLLGGGAGSTPVDIAADLGSDRTAITVQRGRKDDLSDFPAGTCVVPLTDTDRRYDSLNSASPYAGNIVPGRRLELKVGGVTIFTGKVLRWRHRYRQNAPATTTLVGEDALAQLARPDMDQWTTTSQLPGDRINAVLDRPEVDFGLARLIDSGRDMLQADTVAAGTKPSAYLQTVARSDLGRVFADTSNRVVFRDRNNVPTTPVVEFRDDGLGWEVEDLDRSDDGNTLYTRVKLTRVGGVTQIAEDTTASDAYEGVRTLTRTGLLLASDTTVLAHASYLLRLYSSPQQQIEKIRVTPSLIADDGLRSTIVGLDLGDVIRIVWTPLGVGDPLDRYCIVESITHTITSTRHDMTLGLSDLFNRTPFIIGDPVFGVIGGPGRLAF